MYKLIDRLLDKPYGVIDFLPLQIPQDANIRFLDDVEQFFLTSPEIEDLARKFAHIILKTLCYFDFEMVVEEHIKTKDCKIIANAIKSIVIKQKGSISFLLPKEETLIQITGGQLTIGIYNSNFKVQKVMKLLATAEGLFWWKPTNDSQIFL